jgi:hypothetical protein
VVPITASSTLNGHDHPAVDAFSQAIGDSTGAVGQDIIDPFRESLYQFLHRLHVSPNDSSMPIVEKSLRHAVEVLPVSPSLILASIFGSREVTLPPTDTRSVRFGHTDHAVGCHQCSRFPDAR